MTITLPDEVHAKAEANAKKFGFASVNEYVADLVEGDDGEIIDNSACDSKLSFNTREELEALLLEGMNSGPLIRADAEFWAERRRILEEKIAAKQLVESP